MAFDINTAKPVGGGFDITTANPVADVDVPFSTRAGLSVKITPQGKQQYLESKYGKGNVIRNGDGEFFVKSGAGVKAVDPSGLDFGDIADFADVGVELAPMIASAIATKGASVPATATPAGAGAFAGAGRAARQVVSEMLPGEEDFGTGGRAGDITLQALIGGGAQKFVNSVVSPIVDKLRPQNLVAKKLQGDIIDPVTGNKTQIAEDAANEQALIERLTGRKFMYTPGQESQSRGTLTMEGMARRHPASADIVDEFDQNQNETVRKALESVRDRVYPNTNQETVGNAIERDFSGRVAALRQTRSQNASKAFETVDKVSGGRPVFETSNTVQALDNLISQFDSPQVPQNVKGIVGQLKQLRQTFANNSQSQILGPNGQPMQTPVMLTGKEMQNLLQNYGKASKGGDFFGLGDTQQSKWIAGQIYDGLKRDLDSVAPQNDAVAKALKFARDQYKADSAPIQAMKESTLGRIMGGNAEIVPENLVGKFMKMQPSQIKSNMKLLDIGTQKQIQSAAIDSWLAAGKDVAGSAQRVGGVNFSPAKTLSEMDDETVAALFHNDPGALMQLKTLKSALQRLNDRAGTGGSPTTPLMQAFELAKGLITSDPRTSIKTVANVLTPRHIANAMTTPQGRMALMQIVETKPGTRLAEGTISRLMAAGGVSTGPEQEQELPQ